MNQFYVFLGLIVVKAIQVFHAYIVASLFLVVGTKELFIIVISWFGVMFISFYAPRIGSYLFVVSIGYIAWLLGNVSLENMFPLLFMLLPIALVAAFLYAYLAVEQQVLSTLSTKLKSTRFFYILFSSASYIVIALYLKLPQESALIYFLETFAVLILSYSKKTYGYKRYLYYSQSPSLWLGLLIGLVFVVFSTTVFMLSRDQLADALTVAENIPSISFILAFQCGGLVTILAAIESKFVPPYEYKPPKNLAVNR